MLYTFLIERLREVPESITAYVGANNSYLVFKMHPAYTVYHGDHI